MTRITQQQLESHLWDAAVLLRGTIDAGDYKQFIFPLLFFKRLCDVYDEETVTALRNSGGDQDFALFPENHRFQVPADAHWREIRKVNRDVGNSLQQAMRAIEVANQDKLMGIFGDAQWSNKDRLSDAMLRDLIEHFSTLELTVANLPEDELGQGYEYLIKKFADDSGHTAAEFYTNRTVVHLMTEMLDVQPGESVYDPTCGSGGMLLSCITHLRRAGKEWRNVKLYGQERNLMTSSIARMNCFLHGIEDFRIERGDTLAEPKLVEGDSLKQFDVVLANPPYSIKQWNREAFASDPWGRNLFGVPPQGRADFAFQQHILQSLKPKTGRCAVLWPHGVLFRQEEAEIRRKLIEADLVECVLGLGPNLFYNSPMEACVVICRSQKPKSRRGKILFINALNEVTRERAQSFLTDEHIQRILLAYQDFKDEPGLTRVATIEEIRSKDGNLSIPLYVESVTNTHRDEAVGAANTALPLALAAWISCSRNVHSSITALEDLTPQTSITIPDGLITNPSWATLPMFDRSSWKRVCFGDVVENRNDTCDPAEAGLDRFVAMEHLEPGSLHVRSWGNVADGTTFTRLCQPGQVLFGKRRAYQRKVAVAEFEAVVSGDIYVFAPKGTLRLLPELLPFLCMSERFFQHAVGTSAGSLSPRTNWSSLASFEFDLPPLDQQRRIAKILWAVDEANVQYQIALQEAETHLAICLNTNYASTNFGKQVSLCDVSDVRLSGVDKKTLIGEEAVRLCNYLDVYRNRYILENMSFMHATAKASEIARFELMSGDVLITKDSEVPTDIAVPSLVMSDLEGVLCGYHLAIIRPNQAIVDPKYLSFLFRSSHAKTYFSSRAKGVTRFAINLGDIRSFQFRLPSLVDQVLIANESSKAEAAVIYLRKHCLSLKTTLIELLNTSLGT